MMAKRNYKTLMEKILNGFLPYEDALKSILESMVEDLMRVENEAKVGAEKYQHSEEEATYFPGYGVRKLPSRVETTYLLVRKLRKARYIPFLRGRESIAPGGIADSRAGGVYQWGIHTENRAAGKESYFFGQCAG